MTDTITSPHNERLKELRKLQQRRERERSGLFAVEGEDLIEAAHAAGRPARALYAAAGSGIGGQGWIPVEPELLDGVSTLGSGTRAIGVYEQVFTQPAGPLCVYLHGVGDPGNVGTVLRSAHAFGASCVALGPGCADPHGPKAVRASMGAIFAVALARVDDLAALPGEKIALVAREGERLDGRVGAGGDTTLVVGAERDGLPEAVVAACDRIAHIAIRSESLNAAMAATVALYELTHRIGA